MKPCVIYARISPRKMVRDEAGRLVPASDSIENQIQACRDYAAAHDLEVVGEPYIDRLVSGLKRRPNFEAALQKAADLDGCLLCMELSRCYRSMEHLVKTIAFCEKNRVAIVTVMGDGFEVEGGLKSADRLLAQVLTAVHEFMARHRAERISAAMFNLRQQKACYLGGKIPYGFRLSQHREGKHYMLVPRPRQVAIVNYLLYCRRRKISMTLASEHLNAKGLLRPNGKPWNRNLANAKVKWWQEQLQQPTPIGDLCRQALQNAKYKDHPWKLVLKHPPRAQRKARRRKPV